MYVTDRVEINKQNGHSLIEHGVEYLSIIRYISITLQLGCKASV